MTRLSTTVITLIITVMAFSVFAGVSLAFSPASAVDEGNYIAPGAFGFTPTPGSGGVSTQSTGGGGPPSIPEPTTVILTGLGLAGLAGYVARKRRGDSDDSPEE